eukprot:CAMPEP_0202744908 /NCGR_PEP_ID=MMETSP1388-20130828/6961_1 /ASSEMBLY_ACC=CAM_ASM_000864 /TAXON_ID=37098 /ORGANISM="Isochrysis sp, Strain CCMP1244" /LENGTH=190 /DNA_ID=CAMNT_0049412047 /DNA_START=93 /DNA_END=666 /DNA_ORIENTATION=-
MVSADIYVAAQAEELNRLSTPSRPERGPYAAVRRRRDGLAGGARGVALGDLDVVEQVDVVAAAWHVVDRHRVVRVPPDGGDVRGDVGAVAAERQHLQLVRLWLVGVGSEAAAKGFLDDVADLLGCKDHPRDHADCRRQQPQVDVLTQRERQREGEMEKKRDVWREYESGTGVPLMRSAWSRLTSGDLGQG